MSESLQFKNCPRCKFLLSQKNYPNFCPSCGQDLIAASKDLEGILARIPTYKPPRPRYASSVQPILERFGLAIVIGLVIWIISLISNTTNVIIHGTPTPDMGPVRDQSSTLYNCYSWNKITANMVGRNVCVYGLIKHVNGTLYQFSDDLHAFFLFSSNPIIGLNDDKPLISGECVRVTGALQVKDYVPYINMDDLLQDDKFQNFKGSPDPSDCP